MRCTAANENKLKEKRKKLKGKQINKNKQKDSIDATRNNIQSEFLFKEKQVRV